MSEKTLKPFAWAAVALDASEAVGLFRHKQFAEELCRKEGWALVPLYSQPQLTLTDAEREAINEAIKAFYQFAEDEIYAATLRGLLERMK